MSFPGNRPPPAAPAAPLAPRLPLLTPRQARQAARTALYRLMVEAAGAAPGAGGWPDGQELALWARVIDPAITDPQTCCLRWLATVAEGWWTGKRFYSLARWARIYRGRTRPAPADARSGPPPYT